MIVKKIWSNLLLGNKIDRTKITEASELHVFIKQIKNKIIVDCGKHKFNFLVVSPVSINVEYADFAVWLCLPLAMSEDKTLIIHGSGTSKTKENAEELSNIWSSWLPKKYSMINVEFKNYREIDTENQQKKSLMCFSGGVDSTFSLITNDFGEQKPDLLTVQGMDYSLNDAVGFKQSIEQTNCLVKELSGQRSYVQSNAYDIYKKYRIGGQLSHVFLLSAVGFMFAKSYKTLFLASDHSFYQQFEVFPAGSSFASNRFFDSGDFNLQTLDELTTRAEKLTTLFHNATALESLSFCKNRKIRPKNCGVCSKCLRTKYMFLASVGEIPKTSFLNYSKPSFKKLKFSNQSNLSDSYLKDTYKVAFRNGNLDKVPDIVRIYNKIQKGN